ncbi:unnamed protein product [Nyctereutes procyonoides]|uniref:(raccoon dog) hypothetical protein n=1 Tax=Nyctereutes procyonoides TaxID=34880 RepID=A0A811XXJ2_NYCPR|nr:unnamed protein product [Nyctereutes procyonoides]
MLLKYLPVGKKQNQQQPPPPQQPLLPEREETGDEESALHRGPPGSRGPMIPPVLSVPPPPRGRGPIWGGLGPRCSPYGHGWWGANTEPPFPGPGLGQRNPQRLKCWSLIKNTYKSNCPVCRHFAKKGHRRYEDLCAFHHPGVDGPPL